MVKTKKSDIHKGAIFLALFLCVAYTASFFAEYAWQFDLLRHFIFQYWISALTLLIALCLHRNWYISAAMLLVLIGTSYEIIATTKQNAAHSNTQSPTFSIATYNRYYTNNLHDNLISWLNTESPDIVIIQEASSAHSTALEVLRDQYPHQIHEPREDASGAIIISRHKILEHETVKTPHHVFDNYFIKAEVKIHDDVIVVYAMHPMPPISAAMSHQRNSDLAFLAQDITQNTAPNIIVAGDWNITPYSPYFKKFVRRTNLKNQYTSIIPTPTWPSVYKHTMLQIPIDHILHKGTLQLIEKDRALHMSSDHYPIIARFELSQNQHREYSGDNE